MEWKRLVIKWNKDANEEANQRIKEMNKNQVKGNIMVNVLYKIVYYLSKDCINGVKCCTFSLQI